MKFMDITPSNLTEHMSFIDAEVKRGTNLYAMVHATWCGACKRVGPIWRQLASRHDINATVLCVDSDAMKMMRHVIDESTIRYFPTFLRIQGKRRFVFENPSNPTVDTFAKWITKTNRGTRRHKQRINKKKQGTRNKKQESKKLNKI